MITLVRGGGVGYAATSDLSDAGLRAACARAGDWAEAQARLGLFDAALYPRSAARIEYASPVAEPWDALPFSAKLDLLQDACAALEIDERIVDWSAWLGYWHRTQLLTTSDGGRVLQTLTFTEPGLLAVANAGSQTQHRHGGGADWSQQGGLERLAACGLRDDGRRVAEEALALLGAPECPSGDLDLILLPSQMVLQIHESIGHPLELDRILGDERNYAGTSFVTPEMFGTYRYGSDLLNVTFDPAVPGELASFAADDEGTRRRARLPDPPGHPGAPPGRAPCPRPAPGSPGWRTPGRAAGTGPPIDRMANINLEPGSDTLDGPHRPGGARGPDGQQPLLVHRRQPQQVPVRLRVGPPDRGRGASGPGAQPQLPGHLRQLLAQPGWGRRPGLAGGPRGAQLRQGGAQPVRLCRPRRPALPVPQGRRLRGWGMSQDAFFRLAEALCAGLHGDEVLFCALDGEDSDFVRLNRGRIRQAGSVQSQGLGLTLIQGARQIDGGCDLAGDPALDLAQGRDLLARLRERLPETPEDPYLNYSATPTQGEERLAADLPIAADALG